MTMPTDELKKLGWLSDVIERAKEAALKGPRPMLFGSVRHVRARAAGEGE
jgi:hypothetical protein